MMIQLTCVCGKRLTVPEDSAGQTCTCPACGVTLTVPERPPSTAATPPPTIHVTVQGPGATSGLGIAALVLGIAACFSCWVPFCGLLTIPFSVLGVILGGVGLAISLVGRRTGPGMPIAGTAVCVLAILVAVGSTGGTLSAIQRAADRADKTNQDILPPQGSSASAPRPSDRGDGTWASAESTVKQGDVAIRVVSAKVGKVPIRNGWGGEISPSSGSHLAIVLEIRNLSSTRKLDYRTWAGSGFSLRRDKGTLTDNFGNEYKESKFAQGAPEGSARDESLYPGKSLTDVLVFEAPVDKAACLRLELPASNFGGTGMIRLEIPRSMIAGL